MSDRLSSDLASLRISREEPPPRSSFKWGTLAIVIAVLGALGGGGAVGVPMLQAKIFKTEIGTTEIGLVSPAQASIDLTSTGYVVPQTIVKVGAKVTGRIAEVRFKEGDSVKAGAVLFKLDPADQKSAVAAAQARVQTARARAQAARARAQTARARAVTARANLAEVKTQFDREQKLAQTGAVSQASADDLANRTKSLDAQVTAADADADAADAEAKAGDAEALAAQADVESLNVNLGNMTIPAPIDGTATTKPAQIGDVVGPNSELVELADFSSLMVETDVPEARLSMVKKGGPTEIVLDAYPEKRYRGAVVDVSPKLNRAKATGTVKVKFVDDAASVLPEMAARVSFLAKALDAAELKIPPKKIVPTNALVERGGAKHVFVIDNGKVRLVPVTLGPAFGSGFELAEGPPPGTRLVKDPPPALADGQQVKERTD
jgi:RND family efflux transporter MFP subunit